MDQRQQLAASLENSIPKISMMNHSAICNRQSLGSTRILLIIKSEPGFCSFTTKAQSATKEHKRFTNVGDPVCFSVNLCAQCGKKIVQLPAYSI
jgi:hypothetical protein